MKLDDPKDLPRGTRRFVAYWLRDLASGFDSRGFWSLVPFTFLICASLGGAVGWFARDALWTEMQNPIALYAAVFAVNAILLAVCWASFARMMDTLGDREFGAWMRLQKLDGLYGFYIDFIQLTQMVAVTAAGAGLVLSVLAVPEWADRAALGVTVGASAYAARWASGCVRIMQELSDYRATFKEQRANVTPMSAARGE